MSISESTSVFTDDSGSRRRWVVWTLRGASVSLAAAAATALVSVVGHVTLPGLDAPLHLPGPGSRSDPAAIAPDATARTPTAEPRAAASTTPGPTTRTSTADRSGSSGSARTDGSSSPGRPDRVTPTPSVTTPAPAGTTPPAVVTKPRGKPTAKPPTAADPEHSPGNPPTEPPGRAKKSTGSS